jgi:hypothetical protein
MQQLKDTNHAVASHPSMIQELGNLSVSTRNDTTISSVHQAFHDSWPGVVGTTLPVQQPQAKSPGRSQYVALTLSTARACTSGRSHPEISWLPVCACRVQGLSQHEADVHVMDNNISFMLGQPLGS